MGFPGWWEAFLMVWTLLIDELLATAAEIRVVASEVLSTPRELRAFLEFLPSAAELRAISIEILSSRNSNV